MTTKTNLDPKQLWQKYLDMSDEERDKLSDSVSLFISSVWSLVWTVRAKKAAKHRQFDKATYNAVMILISTNAVNRRLDDMRRKGYLT